MIEIYTDGGCHVHSGKTGAWAFVVVENNEKLAEGYGVSQDTTNGFMEVLGLFNALGYALENFDQSTEIIIRCDSQYVVNAYNIWSHNWAKNKWRKSNNKTIEHQATWMLIHELRAPNVKVEWVKAHNGDEWNEYVDTLCTNTILEFK